MPYPSELLPKSNYKGCIQLESLLTLHPYAFLIRKSVSEVKDIRKPKFREIFHNRSDMYGFSTYSFGDYNNSSHFKIRTRARDYWREGDKCLLSEDVDFSDESPSIRPFYLQTQQCHNKPFPIKKTDGNNVTNVLPGLIKVVHRPMVDNYWHFELIVLDEGGEEITESIKNYHKKSAEEFAEEYILQIISADVPPETLLDVTLYQNPPNSDGF